MCCPRDRVDQSRRLRHYTVMLTLRASEVPYLADEMGRTGRLMDAISRSLPDNRDPMCAPFFARSTRRPFRPIM